MIPEAPRGSEWRRLILLLASLDRDGDPVGDGAPRCCGGCRIRRRRCRQSVRPAEAFLAHATHVLLYAILLAMPLLGYLNAAAAGHSVSLFGLVTIPPLIAENERLSQIAIALHLRRPVRGLRLCRAACRGRADARHRQTRRGILAHAAGPMGGQGARTSSR